MKQITLTDRQMASLMNLGKSLNDALTEFRGRTPAEVATAAYSAYTSMLSLQMAPIAVPTVSVKPARAKRRSKKARGPKAGKVSKSDDRTVSIISVLSKSKAPLPASGIAEKLGISGQGLGPVLNKMFSDGSITKKEVDGSFVWGSKSKHLNGKAAHAN